MMRSLYSAVAGLKNHQTKMDVIGNNIANVNTVAFKPSRVVFSDIYSQTIRPAASADNIVAKVGGTNPSQIGLGMTIATIDIMQGAPVIQRTGEALDLTISGDGYFIVNQNNENVFTRAGNFYIDASNNLVTQSGAYVMGYSTENVTRTIATTSTVAQPVIKTPGATKVGTTTAQDTWDPTAADPNPFPDTQTQNLKPITIDPNYKDVSISPRGEIIGIHKDTGEKHYIGQLIIATFDNNSGLQKIGGNLYRETVNSGKSYATQPQAHGAGATDAGGLEMANVDIAQEFSDMITTQRGFQANSRVITVSDTMLEELINLKR